VNTIIDNVLTYTDNFGKHEITAVLGQSARSENYQMLQGYVKDILGDGSSQYRYISLGDADTRKATDDGTHYRGLSFFGRINYNYANRYLASITFRADGSSKYQEKWGYFPSIGLGWILTEEPFMKNQSVFNFLKVRASWGKLGNDKIEASDGFAGIDNAWYVAMDRKLYPGMVLKDYFSWLKWEVVDETNVGLQFNTFNNRLSADFNYFNRITKNAVVKNTLGITGETFNANSGEIKNSGFEFDLNWRDHFNDFTYQIGFNATTLRNRVTKIQSGLDYLLTGVAEFQQIMQVGHPMNSYYGYKVVGVYKDEAEIAADPIAVANGYKPGYLKYEDINHDNVLDNHDRQVLGDPYPSFTYGINIGLQYKNFDFSLSTYGVAGVELMNVKDAQRMYASNMNFTKKFYDDHWSTSHISNVNPSVEGLQRAANGNLSSCFVQNGDYFQIQNIQIGYTVKKLFKMFDTRFYVSADQPFTFFSYSGYTPQVADGYDSTTYPLAATYSVGLRITY
jgi:TonB-linked SusC/RagA family outer membrane protein